MYSDYNARRKKYYHYTLNLALVTIIIHIAKLLGLIGIIELVLIVAAVIYGFMYLRLVFSTRRE